MNLHGPNPARAVDDEGNFTPQWVAFFTAILNSGVSRSKYGTTAQRPTDQLEIGLPYYDTTLGYLICVHQVKPSVVWHNGAGASV